MWDCRWRSSSASIARRSARLSQAKISAYQSQRDPTGEVAADEFKASRNLQFTTDAAQLRAADVMIVAVPTPIDAARLPTSRRCCRQAAPVGDNLKRGAIVVYESTVYPEPPRKYVCRFSSSARDCAGSRTSSSAIRPSASIRRQAAHARAHHQSRVRRHAATLEAVAELYAMVVQAGVYRASSIRVAEAAKVIENTQRDLNIALMNELAIIFNRMGIDTLEVLEAAGTKWNFLPFRPAWWAGMYRRRPILSDAQGRDDRVPPRGDSCGPRINDGMGKFIAEQTVKHMIAGGSSIRGARVTVLGLTFKEDVPDLRNSKVIDIVNELRTFGVEVSVHDPVATSAEAQHEYGIALTPWEQLERADALVAAVAHRHYIDRPLSELLAKLRPGGSFVDVKARFDRSALEKAGAKVWRL
jgi:UDP-N-acetyl-D-galactosamine dehydrogenase